MLRGGVAFAHNERMIGSRSVVLVGLVAVGLAAVIACGETDYTAGVYDKRYSNPPTSDDPPEPFTAGGGGGGGADGGLCDGAGPIDGGPCTVSFKTDLMPLLISSCGSATCHGVPAGAKPLMDRESGDKTYDNFLAQKPITNKPYIDVCSTDKTKSGISCNLAATPCGNGMPYGAAGSLATSDLVTKIDTWLACGAPRN